MRRNRAPGLVRLQPLLGRVPEQYWLHFELATRAAARGIVAAWIAVIKAAGGAR